MGLTPVRGETCVRNLCGQYTRTLLCDLTWTVMWTRGAFTPQDGGAVNTAEVRRLFIHRRNVEARGADAHTAMA